MEYREYSSSLEKYIQILKRRWIPASIIFGIVFSLSFLAASVKKPVYVAEGKLRLRRTNTASTLTGVTTEFGKLEPLVEQKSNPLKTEAEIISSVPLVKQARNRLELKDEKGKPLKPKKIIKNKLTVNEIKGTDLILVSYKDTNSKLATNFVNTLMDVYLKNNVLSNRREAVAARKFIEKQLPNAELVVSRAEAALRNFKETNKIVSVQEETTKLVEYLRELQRRISERQSQVAGIKAQSQTIRNSLGMSTEQAVVLTSLSQSDEVQDILQQIREVENQITDKSTVLRIEHPELVNLENRLINLERILEQRIKKVAGVRKKAISSNLQLGEFKQRLSSQLIDLEAQRQGLESELEALLTLEKSYKQRLNNLPKLEQQQRELERRLQAAQSTYSLLLQKLQETKIAENQNLGNARIIAKAEFPDSPISSIVLNYVSSGLIGMLFFVATAYILEIRDKSIRTVEQAKELTGLSLLGIIPEFGSKSSKFLPGTRESEPANTSLIINKNSTSPVSEYYRMLRANLKFISAVKDLKVIVVTSSVPKEGRSSVAANLAVVMAQMESKVLLVDGDLHHPVQHLAWDIPDNQGLSNVILGQFDLHTAAKQVKKNLDVLTAGKEYIDNLHIFGNDFSPPSPASMLDSKQMGNLVQDFAGSYDFVIIDSPSLSTAADAATLGQLADGILFVVRPGVVDLANAYFAKEFLQQSGQNVIGQVVNGATLNTKRLSYHNFPRNYDSPSSINKIRTLKTEE